MQSEPLPPAAAPGYLTDALRRSGALGDGVVGAMAVDSDRDTIVPAAPGCASAMMVPLLPRRAH